MTYSARRKRYEIDPVDGACLNFLTSGRFDLFNQPPALFTGDACSITGREKPSRYQPCRQDHQFEDGGEDEGWERKEERNN